MHDHITQKGRTGQRCGHTPPFDRDGLAATCFAHTRALFQIRLASAFWCCGAGDRPCSGRGMARLGQDAKSGVADWETALDKRGCIFLSRCRWQQCRNEGRGSLCWLSGSALMNSIPRSPGGDATKGCPGGTIYQHCGSSAPGHSDMPTLATTQKAPRSRRLVALLANRRIHMQKPVPVATAAIRRVPVLPVWPTLFAAPTTNTTATGC